MQISHEQDKLLEAEAKSAQTSKSLGIFWRARQMQHLPPGWLQAGNIMFNPEDRLGHGCEGTVVFRLELFGIMSFLNLTVAFLILGLSKLEVKD